MAKNSPKKNKTEQEVLVEFTITEELLVEDNTSEPSDFQEVPTHTSDTPTKGKTKKLGLYLEWVSEFQTSIGAKFNRFEPKDFEIFPRPVYFANLTAPFSSYSYTLAGSKFHNSKIVLSLDQNGLWFYVSYKENENSDIETKLTKLTHSYEDALIYLNTLPLEVTKDVLVDLEILN